VAIVLPPREGFSPDAVGAIGLLVHRLSDPQDLILGRKLAQAPFTDRHFLPVQVPDWPRDPFVRGAGARYAIAAARILAPAPPDLIEVHNRPEVASMLARRLPRIPVCLFLHNDPRGMRGARSPRARRALAARMRIVAVSDYLRSCFLDGVGPGVTVGLLPNCLDLAALPSPRPPEARERLILFAGRLVADKGADSFVAACAQVLPSLPGWRAEMIGADRFHPGAPDTPFLAMLRPAAGRAGVTLAGYQPHAAVLAAMARAAIVVVPSRWMEPFGMTALEAMACGAALVCSRHGGLAELVADAALVIDPDRPETLAAALLRLGRSEPERAFLSGAGLARAQAFDLPEARARLRTLRNDAMASFPWTPRSR
jgi:glycosyltransferase involved in cell wall biosynthesis